MCNWLRGAIVSRHLPFCLHLPNQLDLELDSVGGMSSQKSGYAPWHFVWILPSCQALGIWLPEVLMHKRRPSMVSCDM